MGKRTVFLILSSLSLVLPRGVYADAEQAGDDLAIFYPEGGERSLLPPSFALIQEPKVTGEVAADWKMVPVWSKVGATYQWTLTVDEGTSLYGTGEVTGALERSGTVVELYNTDNYAYRSAGGKRLYQTHPFVLGVRADGTAFGVIADTSCFSVFDLTDGIKIYSDKAPFRVLVIEKDSPQDVMKALGELTGTIEMPPMWALGYQQCRWSYYPDARVREIADGFRSREIPCDVIWLDIHYMDGYRVFTFDQKRFPDPTGLNNYLHGNGFKTVWMIDPGVKVDADYSVYQSGTKNDVWVRDAQGGEYHGKVWPGDCAFPDYTAPHVAAWWSDLYADFMATGIDGVWNDMNEPAIFGGGTMPDGNQHRGGLVLENGQTIPAGSHELYHNVYGMLMVKASREGIMAANPDKRPFILSRSNYLGGHRYAAMWTGDNESTQEHMEMSIPMSLSIGLSGQPFSGPDAGGFGKNPQPDLMGHWFSLAAFYPFSRGHAMEKTINKEPWEFGAVVEEAAKVSFEKRYRLMPYLYTLFQEASQTGMPVMRPLFFVDPTNQDLRKEDQAFLFGGDLLVIPKWADSPVLPAGFNREVTIVEPSNKQANQYLPTLRIRDGAIIPLTKVMQNTTEYNHSDLTLMVRLNKKGEAAGILYEDAGDGWGFKEGDYRKTDFRAKKVGNRIGIQLEKIGGQMHIPARDLKIQILLDDRTVSIIKPETKTIWINL
ncbi:glycoside hydrolase family 31 protein [Pontiellaceae bacterium B12227]|nr:glycoside hydrolase family 31 protein [Pontiellaceae bacterium B12227]